MLLYYPTAQRIEMDVPCQLQKIGFFLTDNGFIAILKEMSVSFMPSIEFDHISGHQFSHVSRERLPGGLNQQMKIIFHISK
jgi:hypothetical protein